MALPLRDFVACKTLKFKEALNREGLVRGCRHVSHHAVLAAAAPPIIWFPDRHFDTCADG